MHFTTSCRKRKNTEERQKKEICAKEEPEKRGKRLQQDKTTQCKRYQHASKD